MIIEMRRLRQSVVAAIATYALLGLASLACFKAASPSGENTAPIDAATSPVQEAIGSRGESAFNSARESTTASPITFNRGGYRWTITPQAAYHVSALVVSAKSYSSEWNAILSPTDLALVWGDLLSSESYKLVSWSQSGRWYWFQYDGDFEHDNDYIIHNSANTHILPANENLAEAVEDVEPGDLVELNGFLVNVDGTRRREKVWWHSSLTRDDTGDGSCEVLWLTSMRRNGKVYD